MNIGLHDQNCELFGTKTSRGVAALPSNSTTGPSVKSVNRNTESALVGRNPVKVQWHCIGSATVPCIPIVDTDPDFELPTKILWLSFETAIPTGPAIPSPAEARVKTCPLESA